MPNRNSDPAINHALNELDSAQLSGDLDQRESTLVSAYELAGKRYGISDELVEESQQYVRSVFDQHRYGRAYFDGREFNTAFIVPGRVRPSDSGRLDFTSEEDYFMPAMTQIEDTCFRTAIMSSLPAHVIDTYGDKKDAGALVYVPFNEAIAAWRGLTQRDSIAAIRSLTQEAVDLTARSIDPVMIGLGGVLPSFTKHGAKLNMHGIDVTSGHAGTIALGIGHTARELARLEAQGLSEISIGFLGSAGAIGNSFASGIASVFGSNHQVFHHDRRATEVDGAIRVESEAELYSKVDIVVAAISSQVDAVALEGSKVRSIIDDSQPTSISIERCGRLGIDLSWVVGRTEGDEGYFARNTDFNFGGKGAGLARQTDVWGCSAEVRALALVEQPGIARRVEQPDIEFATAMFHDLGLGTDTHQAFGIEVHHGPEAPPEHRATSTSIAA